MVLFAAIGPVFSFYIGFFHSCLTFNPNKPKHLQKEIKIISLIYNIFIGGAGTLLYGLSKICEKKLYEVKWWIKYIYIFYGLIQIIGFILFLLSFTYTDGRKIAFIVIGALSYLFSLFSGISFNIPYYEESLFFF